MKILVIGGGAREHALVWKLNQSKLVKKIYSIPGNGGISQEAEIFNLPLKFEVLKNFVNEKKIDLILVGPEAPLVKGIVDYFKREGIMIFGPNKDASQLEGSKIFAKNFMKKYSIPTAHFEIFEESSRAIDYLKNKEEIVIKAVGLSAGKGVVVSNSYLESCRTIKRFMEEKVFSEAGTRVVIEEKLKGEEASILILLSGDNYSFLISSQDHKPVFEDDKGPNTGGMGAYSPTSLIDEEVMEKIKVKIIQPLIEGLQGERIEYSGVLYLGLMIDKKEPYVLEFNVRFGDPETEAILPLLENDLLEVILKLQQGEKIELAWRKGCSVDVVLASEGYPGKYPKGRLISFKAEQLPSDVFIFHAGTEFKDGNFYTSGGRVLNVAAIGNDIYGARDKVYNAISNIHFDGMHFRRDIGLKEIKRMKDVRGLASYIGGENGK